MDEIERRMPGTVKEADEAEGRGPIRGLTIPEGEATSVLVIRPSAGWAALALKEVWRYRELLYFLTWRDIKVRYKQTALGAAWAIIQPLFMMIVFSIVFGRLAGLPSDGLPYPVFTYTALLPWTYFAYALAQSGGSMVNNAPLISKVFFPRLVIPISSVLAGLLDLGIAFVILIALMLFYGITPGMAIVTLPLFVLFAMATALSVGLWLSALNVKYRDVRYAIPFLVQFWMFASPIAYSSSIVPPQWRTLYGLNPMAGVVEGFRWALLGTAEPPGSTILVSAVIVVILLVGGLFYFRRMERTFADIV